MTRPARTTLIGRHGQVATCLQRVLPQMGFAVTTLGRPDFDLLDPAALALAIERSRPDAVINAAAYTAVDRAEDDAATAFSVNRDAAGLIAAAAARVGAPVVHFSTDYVFDGTQARPYLETDPAGPQGVYGASKFEGEQHVAAANVRHVIVRTSWVCSPFGSNFVKTMLRLASEKPQLSVVNDQTGSPTFAGDIARVTGTLLTRVLSPSSDPSMYGTFHFASSGQTTWYDFATAIMAASRARGGPSIPVVPISTAQYPTRAKRPVYSMLNTAKFSRTFGTAAPFWTASLETCLDELIGQRSAREPTN